MTHSTTARPSAAPTSSSPQSGLVMGTFGNVSAVDRDGRRVRDQAERRAVRRADAGAHGRSCRSRPDEVIDGTLRPSSDTPTHLELYRAFGVRRHRAHALRVRDRCSRRRDLPIRCMGTTHADYFRGDVPVTRPMTQEEVERDYERNTGLVIVETFRCARAVAGRDAGGAGRQSRVVRVGRGLRRSASSTRRSSSSSRAWSGARA